MRTVPDHCVSTPSGYDCRKERVWPFSCPSQVNWSAGSARDRPSASASRPWTCSTSPIVVCSSHRNSSSSAPSSLFCPWQSHSPVTSNPAPAVPRGVASSASEGRWPCGSSSASMISIRSSTSRISGAAAGMPSSSLALAQVSAGSAIPASAPQTLRRMREHISCIFIGAATGLAGRFGRIRFKVRCLLVSSVAETLSPMWPLSSLARPDRCSRAGATTRRMRDGSASSRRSSDTVPSGFERLTTAASHLSCVLEAYSTLSPGWNRGSSG